ncbi:MAG: CCA tRNA nucleotidyltransferase [Bdellovibrionota bacterium]
MIWRLFKRKAKVPENYKKLIDSQALDIVKDLQRGGHRAYLVGGCVRDLLLGMQPKDFDIATSANPFRVKMLIQRSQIIGKRFRIVVARRRKQLMGSKQMIFPPIDRNKYLHEFQITTFRRAPEKTLSGTINENVFGSEKDDAERRDFTLNGLFFDPTSKKIVDYVGGEKDIQLKRIRTIGDPFIRFEEDPVRILRAVRFEVRTGFHLEKQTEAALKSKAACLLQAKKERTREEFLKMAKDGYLSSFIQKLQKYKLLEFVSPCLAKHCHQQGAAFFDMLSCYDRAAKKIHWPNQHLSAPFLFPLLFHVTKNRIELRPETLHLKDDILVSKAELGYLEAIQQTLNRVLKSHRPQQRLFFLQKRNIETQAQFFFTLKMLAECHGNPFDQLWKVNEEFWKELKSKHFSKRARH